MKLPIADNQEYDLSDDLIAGLQLKFAGIDVRSELLLMVLWLHKNPSRRPKLPLRFIEKWLAKSKPKTVKLHIVNGKLTENEIDALGRRLNMPARPGEGYPQWAKRLQAALDRQEVA